MSLRMLIAGLIGALLSASAIAQGPAPVVVGLPSTPASAAPVPYVPEPTTPPGTWSGLQPSLPLAVDAPMSAVCPQVPPPSPAPTLADDFAGPGSSGGFGNSGGFGGAGGLGAPPGPPRVEYRVEWEPTQHVIGQNANLSLERQDLTMSAPVWLDDGDALTFHVHLRNEQINSSAILPTSGMAFPEDLWDVQAGFNYFHRFDNGWTGGVGLSVGSASDKPFQTLNELEIGGSGFLRIPSGDRNAWLFTLAYNSNSQIPIPIPGVAYSWWVNDQLHLNLGLPFAVNYRPTQDLSFDFDYMILTNVRARTTYRLLPNLKIYASYDYGTESYYLADRTDDKDRFFYNEMKLSTGVTYNINEWSTLDLSSGYVFDRQFYQGHNSTSETDLVDVSPGAFVALRLGLHF